MVAAIGRMREAWETEQLPEILRHIAALDDFDLHGASDEEFRAHFDDALARVERLWEIHFEIVLPQILSLGLFDELYGELVGGDGVFDSLALLRGFDSKTIESNRALHALARRGEDVPAVRAALGRPTPADALDALARSREGRDFLAELDAYLDVYGRRTMLYFTPSTPSWVEEPGVVVSSLQAAVRDARRDPDAELAELAAERERLVAEARAALAAFPEAVRDEFDSLLEAAQFGGVLQEDHNFWIDARGTFELRRLLLATGERLVAAGALDTRDDVFHLTPDEVRETLAAPADRRAVVAERKAELARFARVEAPRTIGTFPPGPPPDDVLSRTFGKFLGVPPAPAATSDVVQGVAGSPGVVRARARVVRSFAEADRLQDGEVLVTPTTAPPWTPLFARAAAVVTDAGGVLSHCAVVAREYLIPAVVATGRGSLLIPDGALVEVDGTAGTVRIVEE
jgi:pyruvate,water dikinase